MPPDRLYRAANTGVGTRQEANQWDHQEACVEVLRTVRLHEGAGVVIEPAFANVAVDRVAQDAPLLHRSLAAELLDRLDRAIDGDPGHDLRMGELLSRPADLPDPLV